MNALRILGLDTSGKMASAAVLDTAQDLLLAERSLYTARGHSQIIMPMVQEILQECGMTAQDVDCYAVAAGPGSYTGLRIGIAAVQGMALVRNTPCIGISTLEAMASRCFPAQHILAVMHARAELFYTGWFSYPDRHPAFLCRRFPDRLQAFPEIAACIAATTGQITVVGDGTAELLRQYEAAGGKPGSLLPAPPMLRLQSASGVCRQAAAYLETHETLPTAADLTAIYLQAVNITRKNP